MRITSQMGSTLILGNMNATLDRMLTLQNQMSSGKRITRATDDPVGTSQAMSLRSRVADIDQYAGNVTQGKAQLAYLDSSLGNITKALQDAKRLGLAGGTATADEAQRQNLAVQVQQQIDVILREVNSSYGNRYIFGGFRTADVPVTENAAGTPPYQYNGDDGVLQVPVNDATEIPVSLTAKQVLNFDGATDPTVPDTLSVLAGLRDALKSGDMDGIQQRLKQLDTATNNVVSQRGVMGTRGKQMDAYADRLAESKVTMSDWLSQVEDVDIAETMTSLQAEQNAYQAALIAASRMVQPSLADYLK